MNHIEATRNFLPYLEDWFGGAMARMRGSRDQGDGLLMGCPLWGQAYIDRFQRFCLPSILGERNKAALQGKCRMVLFTDKESSARLCKIGDDLDHWGVDFRIEIIPQAVMEQIPSHPLNKYWVLGVAGNALVQMAGRSKMAFHMLLPDHLYGIEYFPNLERLSKQWEGIAQTGISAHVSCTPEIEEWRLPNETLEIPDRALGSIGLRHLHKQTRASLMREAAPDNMPRSHLLTWQGRDKLVLHCPHMNAAYLSARMCAIAPTRIPATLDAELPSFFPQEFYVPKAGDGMGFIEISDDTKSDDPKRVNLRSWAMHCWERVRFSDDWMPYFKAPCEIPIYPQGLGMDDAEIERQLAILIDGMYEHRPSLALEFIRSLVFQK